MAESCAAYLYEAGVKKLRATKGNLGVQVFRRMHDGLAEFVTISFRGSREEICAYAGDDIGKTQHLTRDPEYLLELAPRVKHFDILIYEWSGDAP